MASSTFGSLFAGIGGFDLGLERAGWEPVWQVENDPYCQRVLAKHWPEVKRYGDIKEIDWAEVERPDLICGGFPCQPVSVAGKQLGTEDDRWLWPEFARCLRVVGPRFVLVENVPGLLSGPMGEVLGDLACLGYDAEWESLPAAAFGAPHLRYRVWIVAHRERDELRDEPGRGNGQDRSDTAVPRDDGSERVLAHAARDAEAGAGEESGAERERTRRSGEPGGTLADAEIKHSNGGNDHRRSGCRAFPEPGDRSQAPGPISGWWRIEPDVGRVAHGVPRRVDRLRGLGNAVVPQVAEWLGRRIFGID